MNDNNFKNTIIVLCVLIAAITAILVQTIATAQNTQIEETEFVEAIDEPVKPVEQAVAPVPVPLEQPAKYTYTQTLTKQGGVYFYNGKKETYYSSRVTYHYMTPQWELDDNGFYHDQNGYFVVSSSEYSYGSVINISMGQAIVLDCGCPTGVIDIYTNW